jgi:tetratricopeptide (TPR) repeat protein
MHLPEGLVYLYAALRGRKLEAPEWLAIGKMLRIPRLALLSFRWQAWRNPQDVAAWFKAAHIHRYVYGELDRALALYEGGLAANPDSLDLWMAKADLLVQRGEFRAALEAYDRAVALTDDKVPLIIEKSRLVLSGRNLPEEALATVNEALAIDPESIPALAWKQSVFLHMGKRDEAEAVNDRILEIDPKNEDALLYRAEVFRMKGKGDLALGVYDAYLLHYPDRMGIWKVRAELLLELHRYPDALESVEKAISFDPEGKEWDMSGAGELRGDILLKLRRWGDALASYDRVLSKNPGWHPAAIWEKKAGAFFALGDYPGTVAACDRAIALGGQDGRDTRELQNLRDAAQKRIQGT